MPSVEVNPVRELQSSSVVNYCISQ